MTQLRTKMLLFILVPTLLFFVGMVVYVSTTVHNLAISDAEEMLDANGEALAYEIRLEFETALRSAQTLSQLFQGIIERGSTPRRENANIMLQQILANNQQYSGAWMIWEPDAFDGQDKQYADKEYNAPIV